MQRNVERQIRKHLIKASALIKMDGMIDFIGP